MKTPLKLVIVGAVLALVAGAFALKSRQQPAPVPPTAAGPATTLPRLLDLGADKCIPCKQMAPVLEELKKEYTDVFSTEFVDVWKNPEAGKQHNIRLIPTQIFFDAAGKELFRHEGFYGKDDILAKWKELGLAVSK